MSKAAEKPEPMITLDEWRTELERFREAAEQRTDGALTSRELGEELGLGQEATLRFLRALKAAGRLEVVTVHRSSLIERVIPKPAYKIKESGK